MKEEAKAHWGGLSHQEREREREREKKKIYKYISLIK